MRDGGKDEDDVERKVTAEAEVEVKVKVEHRKLKFL